MKIPKKNYPKVFSDDPNADRRKEAEDALNAIEERSLEYREADRSADDYAGLFRFSCGFIMWSTIFGTTLLCAASIYYSLIPSPTAHITTQDGGLFPLTPIAVQK